MKLLFENWRKYLNEVTTIPDDIKTSLRQAITNSEFWTKPHTEDSVDIGDLETDRGSELTTPAIETLQINLNNAAVQLGIEIYFVLTVSPQSEYVLRPEDPHGGYPNNWLMQGQYMGPQGDAHIVWLEFRPVHNEFNLNNLDAEKLVKNISWTINHELVHYSQLKKQVKSKNISDEEAWEEMKCDPEQIPVGDPEDYRKRCGKEPPKQGQGRDVYLSRHSEVDAFAHEAAEQLLDKYSSEEALNLIKTRDSKLDGVVRDYLNVFKDDDKKHLLKKFWTKLYTHIQSKGNNV